MSPRSDLHPASYGIVAVETFGRFPAGKTHLGLFVQYGRIGTLLYCRDPLGPNLNTLQHGHRDARIGGRMARAGAVLWARGYPHPWDG